MSENSLPSGQTSLRGIGVICLIALALLLLAGGLRWKAHQLQATTLRQETAQQSVPHVLVVHPAAAAGTRHIELPGTLRGYIETPIFARSNGYLIKWTHDIGDRVGQGELLAEIDTPELNRLLNQAVANQHQTQANLALAISTRERWEQMRLKDVVSQQELDEKRAQVSQLQAHLAAAEADVDRLQSLVAYQRVMAPFSGIITKRNVDVGSLITPGSSDAGQALFMLAQTDPLRVYVYVPQAYANRIRLGQPVALTQPEMPGSVFHGKIERTAGAINTSTRTLQTEVILNNPGNILLPGAFVKVAIPAGQSSALTIPSNTALFRAEGLSVAKVDAAGRVHLQPVTVAQDLGNTLEIASGLDNNDLLILNPPDSIAEGDQVQATLKPADQRATKPATAVPAPSGKLP